MFTSLGFTTTYKFTHLHSLCLLPPTNQDQKIHAEIWQEDKILADHYNVTGKSSAFQAFSSVQRQKDTCSLDFLLAK